MGCIKTSLPINIANNCCNITAGEIMQTKKVLRYTRRGNRTPTAMLPHLGVCIIRSLLYSQYRTKLYPISPHKHWVRYSTLFPIFAHHSDLDLPAMPSFPGAYFPRKISMLDSYAGDQRVEKMGCIGVAVGKCCWRA